MTLPLLTNLDALWVYEAMKTRSQGARCVTHPAQQEPQPHKLSSNKIASSQLGDDDHLVLSCKQRKTAAAAEAVAVTQLTSTAAALTPELPHELVVAIMMKLPLLQRIVVTQSVTKEWAGKLADEVCGGVRVKCTEPTVNKRELLLILAKLPRWIRDVVTENVPYQVKQVGAYQRAHIYTVSAVAEYLLFFGGDRNEYRAVARGYLMVQYTPKLFQKECHAMLRDAILEHGCSPFRRLPKPQQPLHIRQGRTPAHHGVVGLFTLCPNCRHRHAAVCA